MTLKIATWNVNSLRVRLPHVLAWLETEKPDILAVQETKVTDDLFPTDDFEKAGYHVIFCGQKTYNGMAIISKKPLTEVETSIPKLTQDQKRVLGACYGNVRIWDIYVPNGESVQSEKYPFKLEWLKNLREFLQAELKKYPQLIVLGDFNIAPENRDVYDPAAWEGHVLFSEPERMALKSIVDLGLRDCFRLHHQDDKNYTWWDYRMNAFKRKIGLRIDHILASQELDCVACTIDKTPRGWERPSDHAPVIAEFKLGA